MRNDLVTVCFRLLRTVTGFCGFEKDAVTGGGICEEDSDARPLESHGTPGLYFAGEIRNVDGREGGFNLHWAWASAYAAASAILRKYFRDPDPESRF